MLAAAVGDDQYILITACPCLYSYNVNITIELTNTVTMNIYKSKIISKVKSTSPPPPQRTIYLDSNTKLDIHNPLKPIN